MVVSTFITIVGVIDISFTLHALDFSLAFHFREWYEDVEYRSLTSYENIY